jgi:actin-related protein
MASMQSFESIMMTKEDYDEHGFVLIDKKCFE